MLKVGDLVIIKSKSCGDKELLEYFYLENPLKLGRVANIKKRFFLITTGYWVVPITFGSPSGIDGSSFLEKDLIKVE